MLVITTPEVLFGKFLISISFLFNNLTLIFNPSILFSFGFSVIIPFDLKSSEVSNLPSMIILFTSLLWFAKPSHSYLFYTLVIVGIANFFYELSLIFYNSLLKNISKNKNLG